MTITLEETCVHEAGHAAIAIFHQVDIEEVSVEPDEEAGSLGHVKEDAKSKHQAMLREIEVSPDYSVDAEPFARGLVALEILAAGGEAVRVHLGLEPNGCEGDWEAMNEIVSRMTESAEESAPLREFVFAKCNSRLHRPELKAAVKALAESLEGRRRLSQEEAKAIFYEATTPAALKLT